MRREDAVPFDMRNQVKSHHTKASVGLPIALLSVVFFFLLTIASPTGTFWNEASQFVSPLAGFSQALTMTELVFILEADFLAFAVLILSMPTLHRMYDHVGVGVRVKHALTYITYVVEPKFKKLESMLLYLA